ncbi:MAG: ribosome biogenesis GTPase Der [Microscillaceae bacterium]|nr:ribosome biogenesis GTPase Der [Microscillaceae bacterium]MDW8461014.1 ribosome biogenesis GTPase Der [Cytophagales bacterium]
MANIVAIVGRPNVGKSTFFNRMIEQKKSITDNQSGVTRDRIYGQAEWQNKLFTLIDTGGYVVGSNDVFEESIREQVEIAIEEAKVILFMVDCQTGLTDLDKEFAKVVRKANKPVYVVANKADTAKELFTANEFYALGWEKIFPISSQTGSGTGDLLDEIVKYFPSPEKEDETSKLPKLAIIGRPNVGKSSFMNTLLGKQRSIVTDIAGTTRDSVNSHYKAFGKEFILIDTAGIRRKSRIKNNLEFYAILRAVKAIEESDVCIIMLDATRGIESQDVNILGLAERNGKGMVIMVNKWDLIEKDTHTAKKFTEQIRERLPHADYVPIIFTSVLEKQRIFQTIEKAIKVYENKTRKVPTSQLNEVMLAAIEAYPPPAVKGKLIKIKYITQIAQAKTPTFLFFCNLPQYIQPPYQRYLENQLRKAFDFEGVPLQLFFRKK